MSVDITSTLAAGVIFATVLFFMLGLATGQTTGSTAARQRLEGLTRGPGYDEPVLETRPFTGRVLAPVMHAIVGGFGSLLPKSLLRCVERKLVIAGEPMTMTGFLTMV